MVAVLEPLVLITLDVTRGVLLLANDTAEVDINFDNWLLVRFLNLSLLFKGGG